MLTFSGQRNLFGTLTNNTTSANLTVGDTLINAHTNRLLSLRSWPFLRRTKTALTEADTQFYKLPANFRKLVNVTVTVGGFNYTPKECPSRRMWDVLNTQNTQLKSSIPEWYFVYNRQVGFWPVPPSGGNTITYYYTIATPIMTQADYTTGTIVTATLDGAAIVGSSTVWNASMVGRYIQIAETSAALGGDNLFYEIESIGSNTTLTLVNDYLGTSIASGAATYLIGQVSPLPDGYHELPVYRGVHFYYTTIAPDAIKAGLYKDIADNMENDLIEQFGRETANVMIEEGGMFVNPNLVPMDISDVSSGMAGINSGLLLSM